jgi:hypothetical protein
MFRIGDLLSTTWIGAGLLSLVLILGFAVLRPAAAQRDDNGDQRLRGFDAQITLNAARMLREGRRTFRSDTLGSEAFWGDTLKLHLAVAGAAGGGVGPGLSPAYSNPRMILK